MTAGGERAHVNKHFLGKGGLAIAAFRMCSASRGAEKDGNSVLFLLHV